MEQTIITNTLLPIALGVIMLGLGLSLTVADFTRVVRFPKAIIVGLTIQMVVLTSICFVITILFKLPPELAVGMMLLAAAPGGATANIYSHLAHGDVALNITLTAINSLLSLFALPVTLFVPSNVTTEPTLTDEGLIVAPLLAVAMIWSVKPLESMSKIEKLTFDTPPVCEKSIVIVMA